MRHTPCGCRFACVSAAFSNLRLLCILSDLQVPTKAALLRSPRLFALSVEGGRTALAAAGTTENACTVDRRKLGCTCARSAERQRAVEVSQIVSHPQWRRAKQCRHAEHFHSPGAAPLQAASRQCNFLWVGQREGYLFFKKRYPSLISFPCGEKFSPEATSCRGRTAHGSADAARSAPPARRCWTRRGSSRCPSPW